jgi:hypothetical protein
LGGGGQQNSLFPGAVGCQGNGTGVIFDIDDGIDLRVVILGFGSYDTAWHWLQKLRRCTIRKDLEKLTGRVEVDEFVGSRSNLRIFLTGAFWITVLEFSKE